MEQRQFDGLTKALASSVSRRTAVKAILATALGGMLGFGLSSKSASAGAGDFAQICGANGACDMFGQKQMICMQCPGGGDFGCCCCPPNYYISSPCTKTGKFYGCGCTPGTQGAGCTNQFICNGGKCKENGQCQSQYCTGNGKKGVCACPPGTLLCQGSGTAPSCVPACPSDQTLDAVTCTCTACGS